jgi:hypothetical protein
VAILSTYDLKKLSCAARVDERTLLKALAGFHVTAMPLERITIALAEAGLAQLLPGKTIHRGAK